VRGFVELCGFNWDGWVVDEGCDCDSGNEHEERMEGGAGELV